VRDLSDIQDFGSFVRAGKETQVFAREPSANTRARAAAQCCTEVKPHRDTSPPKMPRNEAWNGSGMDRLIAKQSKWQVNGKSSMRGRDLRGGSARKGPALFHHIIIAACLSATALTGTQSLVSTIQTPSFTLDGPTR
jgi:hypothetical protein